MTLRWAMQRACDAGVIPSGAVIRHDRGAISDAADRQGATTLIVSKPGSGLLSRIREGDSTYGLAADLPCSVLLI
jgi:hypothetical protein